MRPDLRPMPGTPRSAVPQRPARRYSSTGVCLAVLFALLSACVPLQPHRHLAPIRSLPTSVEVRLSSAEGAAEIELATERGSLILRRMGNSIEASDGRSGDSIVTEASSYGALGAYGKEYPGRLRVELHPRSGLRVVNEVGLEAYVAGVVASEVSLWSAQPAELEAMAIAARTYALVAHEDGAVLYDDTRDQAYRGRFRMEATPKNAELSAKLQAAIAATRGATLCEADGNMVDVRYHAACGGRTADSARAAGVACSACAARAETERLAGHPDAKRPLAWRQQVDASGLANFAQMLEIGTRVLSLSPIRVDPAGRWLEIEVIGDRGKRRIPFDRLRHLLGPASIKSALILRTIPRDGEAISGSLEFEGLGRGHGIGLCQEGTRDCAALGWSSTKILQHYYPGASLCSDRTLPHYPTRR
ncbi:MAG: stage II sporulation protein D [Planctomycetota bacterium]|jgi:stage II sporulation protein D